MDHVNVSSALSPRSIQYPRPATAPPLREKQHYMEVVDQVSRLPPTTLALASHPPPRLPTHRAVLCPTPPRAQNNRLLRSILNTESVYKLEALQREAMAHAQHSRRLSNFRGPPSARCAPMHA